MKTKLFVFSILCAFVLLACSDSYMTMGTSVQPDSDRGYFTDDTFSITARTVRADSVYSKVIYGALGEFFDPSFGSLHAGFACEFYPALGFVHLDSIIRLSDSERMKIDSVQIHFAYSFIGDSLAPMEVSIYRLKDKLPKNYYTSVDPKTFSESQPLIRYSYTARNLQITDSLREALGYANHIYINLPDEYGQAYLDSVKSDTAYVTNLDRFTEAFKGLYFESSFGTGSLLYSIAPEVYIYYTAKQDTVKLYETNEDGSAIDSVKYESRYTIWTSTKEVRQINNYTSSNDEALLQPNDTMTYIKTPVGLYTELAIPMDKIERSIGTQQFAAVALTLYPYPQDDWDFALPFPGYYSSNGEVGKMMLIEPDSLNSFFEQQKIVSADNNCFATTYSTSTGTYDFTNISHLVQSAIDNNLDTLKLWVVPIQTAQTTDTYGTTVDYASSPYMLPSALKLKTRPDSLIVRVVGSQTGVY